MPDGEGLSNLQVMTDDRLLWLFDKMDRDLAKAQVRFNLAYSRADAMVTEVMGFDLKTAFDLGAERFKEIAKEKGVTEADAVRMTEVNNAASDAYEAIVETRQIIAALGREVDRRKDFRSSPALNERGMALDGSLRERLSKNT